MNLRAISAIETLALKPKESKYTDQDISTILFTDNYPRKTVKPFSKLHNSRLSRVTVTFNVSCIEEKDLKLDILPNAIYSVGNTVISDKLAIFNMSPIFCSVLLASYKELSTEWYDFIVKRLRDYCDQGDSKLQWASLQQNLKVCKKVDIFETKYWIFLNTVRDREMWIDLAAKMKESMLPFINYKLWSELRKRDTNRRENVDHDQHIKEMLEGSFGKEEMTEELLKITNKDFSTSVDDSSLDIIR